MPAFHARHHRALMFLAGQIDNKPIHRSILSIADKVFVFHIWNSWVGHLSCVFLNGMRQGKLLFFPAVDFFGMYNVIPLPGHRHVRTIYIRQLLMFIVMNRNAYHCLTPWSLSCIIQNNLIFLHHLHPHQSSGTP